MPQINRLHQKKDLYNFRLTKKLSEIKLGETATIVSFLEDDISDLLLKMGFIPGEKVTVERFAPLGDPMIILVAGYRLSMRKSEADKVIVK